MSSVTNEVSVCVSVSLRLRILSCICLAGCRRSVFAVWGCSGQNVCRCSPFHVSFQKCIPSLSVSFIPFPVQQCLSRWAALPPVSDSSFSYTAAFFYPFILTPGILCPVLFPLYVTSIGRAWILECDIKFSDFLNLPSGGFCSRAIIQLILFLYHFTVCNLTNVIICNSLWPKSCSNSL